MNYPELSLSWLSKASRMAAPVNTCQRGDFPDIPDSVQAFKLRRLPVKILKCPSRLPWSVSEIGRNPRLRLIRRLGVFLGSPVLFPCPLPTSARQRQPLQKPGFTHQPEEANPTFVQPAPNSRNSRTGNSTRDLASRHLSREILC